LSLPNGQYQDWLIDWVDEGDQGDWLTVFGSISHELEEQSFRFKDQCWDRHVE